MDESKKVLSGFKKAKKITSEYAKTFYFASLFLPGHKRKAAYSIYAICRLCDEAVDDNNSSQKEGLLNDIINKLDAVYKEKPLEDELFLAFKDTVTRYDIKQEYFLKLIEGMQMDLSKSRYDDFAQLYDYCYKAAGVVGLMMLNVFGSNNPKAKDHAVDLGIAMQLTNILRDVKEDYLIGRIYLPVDELNDFGVLEDDIKQEKINVNLRNLLKFQINRARSYYKNAQEGLKFINSPVSRFVINAMADIYSGILDNIEKHDYDIFSKRAKVNVFGKLCRIAKIILKGI